MIRDLVHILRSPRRPDPELVACRDECTRLKRHLLTVEKSADYWHTRAGRFSTHLDDIRCDVAEAGILPDPNGDPELEPRAMVQRLIARGAVVTDTPRRAVPEERRRAILAAVNEYAGAVDAPDIAITVWGSATAPEVFPSTGTVERTVSHLLEEGWLERIWFRRRAHYSLTPKGRADLEAAAAAMWSTG